MKNADKQATDVMLVRERLAVLGLTFRIEGMEVPDRALNTLLCLTARVIECVSHTPPEEKGQSLFITEMRSALDAAGWVTDLRKLEHPYWIPKADISKLGQLEDFLDILASPKDKVGQALHGLFNVDGLSYEEQEEYFERFDDLLSKPSATADAFFKDMRERGLGVGMDDAGNIVYATPENSIP